MAIFASVGHAALPLLASSNPAWIAGEASNRTIGAFASVGLTNRGSMAAFERAARNGRWR